MKRSRTIRELILELTKFSQTMLVTIIDKDDLNRELYIKKITLNIEDNIVEIEVE